MAGSRPVLVYDGKCGFCSRWVRSWRRALGEAVEVATAEEAGKRFPSVPREQMAASLQLVEPDGRVASGAAAVFEAFAAGGKPWLRWAYRRLPGFAPASEAIYRLVARHREAMGKWDLRLFGEGAQSRFGITRSRALFALSLAYPVAVAAPVGIAAAALGSNKSRWRLLRRPRRRRETAATRWLFLRLLGVVYFAAFASLRVQVRGLAGERGILPARDTLAFLRRYGRRRFSLAPTLLWLDDSDRALVGLCKAGEVLSTMLVLGIAPLPVLALLWSSYLSLVVGGQSFLQYQWDALLLETGLLAMLYAPLRVRESLRHAPPPPAAATWLLRWLVFRVMFSSGIAKVVSRDRSWRAATALQHHYETQPLPTWTSAYAHQLPRWFHRLSVYGVWVCEVLMPPLGLTTRRFRAAAFATTTLLQALIAATGNYGFFNLLTVALAVPLLDDDMLPRWLRGLRGRAGEGEGSAFARWAALPAGAALFLLGMIPLAEASALKVPWPRALLKLYSRAARLFLANPYGLFAVMTTERPELIVEGSEDGRQWLAYEFRWKPGDPSRRPAFLGLHMPRLDWQMWFAALSPSAQQHWLVPLLVRLLEGEPEVLRLLAKNPFPERPPRALRVRIYEYRFARREQRLRTGWWWERELVGDLFPWIGLGENRLRPEGRAPDEERGSRSSELEWRP